MTDNFTERWQLLCQQAAAEQDPVKLLELVTEINRLFDEKDLLNQKAKLASGE